MFFKCSTKILGSKEKMTRALSSSSPLGPSSVWARCRSEPGLSAACFCTVRYVVMSNCCFTVVVVQVFNVSSWCCFQKSFLLIYLSMFPICYLTMILQVFGAFFPNLSPANLDPFDICYALFLYLCERFFQQSAILWHTFFDWWHLLCYTSIFGI